MKTVNVLILVVLLVSTSIADDVLVTEEYGFSIQPPIAKEVKNYPYVMSKFFLPVTDGFSANVNVMKQAFDQSMEVYDKISMKQFEQMNGTYIQHKIRDKDILYDLKVNVNGKEVHCYSRALKQGDFVFLVTATGLENHWEQQKSELMKSVDSFKLTK